MNKLSPEIEALITTIVYLNCRVEAILRLLEDRGISLESKEVDSKTRSIHSMQGSIMRYQISCRMKDQNFDIK
jgi:deoxyadenosine/deoxycytidine kinase